MNWIGLVGSTDERRIYALLEVKGRLTRKMKKSYVLKHQK